MMNREILNGTGIGMNGKIKIALLGEKLKLSSELCVILQT